MNSENNANALNQIKADTSDPTAMADGAAAPKKRLPLICKILYGIAAFCAVLYVLFVIFPDFSDFFNRYISQGLRRLLAATAVSPPLWRAVDAPRPLREAAQPSASTPLLTVENDTVSVAGKPIPLTAAEWAIFHCLYTHRGEAVTKETLFSLLGGGGNSVEVYVCKLRTKIEKPLGKWMIWTVRGVGYKMEI